MHNIYHGFLMEQRQKLINYYTELEKVTMQNYHSYKQYELMYH